MPESAPRPDRWARIGRVLKRLAIAYLLVCGVMFVAQGWLTFLAAHLR